ncbi:unnamed protein product [Mytilus edulis]|uniref:Uncharacterized protein n=1 Tax=Mytilus edulis TaxID=6550 RepID=A0A8S3TK02_MYTED|nr:unnamed protein product [Mytilus edulis]
MNLRCSQVLALCLCILFLTLLNHFLHLLPGYLINVKEQFGNTPYVPRILHFISVEPFLKDNDTILEDVKSIIDEWKSIHVNYQVIVWTSSKIKHKFSKLANLLKKIPNPSWISDIVRFKVSYEYGGLYLDTDIRAIRSVEPLLRQFKSGFVVCEQPRINNLLMEVPCDAMGTAVIASNKNSILMKILFEKSVRVTQKYLHSIEPDRLSSFYRRTIITGPPLLTNVNKKSDIPVIGSITFYPCDWSDRSKCVYEQFTNGSKNIYAMHQWRKRW